MISKNLLLFGRRWVEAGQMMDTLETKTRAGEMVQAVPVAIIWTNPICVALEDRGKLLLPGQVSYVPILAARICFPSLLWHLVRGQWWQPWSWSFLSFSSCWVSCGQHQQHSQQCLGVTDPREVPQGSPGISLGKGGMFLWLWFLGGEEFGACSTWTTSQFGNSFVLWVLLPNTQTSFPWAWKRGWCTELLEKSGSFSLKEGRRGVDLTQGHVLDAAPV